MLYLQLFHFLAFCFFFMDTYSAKMGKAVSVYLSLLRINTETTK